MTRALLQALSLAFLATGARAGDLVAASCPFELRVQGNITSLERSSVAGSGRSTAAADLASEAIPLTEFGTLCSFRALRHFALSQLGDAPTRLSHQSPDRFPTVDAATDRLETRARPVPVDDRGGKEDRWKIRLFASHSFTSYFSNDIAFRSSRYNVDVRSYEWKERGSREFFNPKTWFKKGNNPLQIFDEPSNTYALSAEKNNREFSLSMFHPKFFHAPDQIKYVNGTIDGTPVDGFVPINKPFDGYDQIPGEMELVRNENTAQELALEFGFGRRIKLTESKAFSISTVPGVGAGVMVGRNYTVVVKPGEWWEFDDYTDGFGIQGFGGSLTNRVEFNFRTERFGIFYATRLSIYRLHHGFLDGTQRYTLGFLGNSVGIKFMLYNP
ncbi:MAG TPA: hypothetical protein VFY29_03600 [Terriglobia bacterium]|nr:hypothetical protein [Terriglobia bacterium]